MIPHMHGKRFWFFAIAAAMVGGCETPPAPPAPALAQVEALTLQAKDLQDEIDRLKADNDILIIKNSDVLKREEVLSDELRRLQFRSQQQEKLIDSLKDAPSQRDYYRDLSQRQSKDIQALQEQVKDLQKRLAAAHAPATGPAKP